MLSARGKIFCCNRNSAARDAWQAIAAEPTTVDHSALSTTMLCGSPVWIIDTLSSPAPPGLASCMTCTSCVTHPSNWINLLAVVSAVPPVLRTYRHAMHDPLWHTVVTDEDQALLKNHTWSMIRLKLIYNFLCSMLVYTQFALCFVYTS
jgi:hypothetical protein